MIQSWRMSAGHWRAASGSVDIFAGGKVQEILFWSSNQMVTLAVNVRMGHLLGAWGHQSPDSSSLKDLSSSLTLICFINPSDQVHPCSRTHISHDRSSLARSSLSLRPPEISFLQLYFLINSSDTIHGLFDRKLKICLKSAMVRVCEQTGWVEKDGRDFPHTSFFLVYLLVLISFLKHYKFQFQLSFSLLIQIFEFKNHLKS